jgi:UDP-N-acetylglucosamine--N-acetylmuramyl-(pentapeptide) pyrophosphoryl-undecaprenol N-acetylglucosamine transferase
MSRVLIMAGGTGGHVFPGLAVARRLLENQVQVVWLGTRRGIEAQAVPASGLAIDMEWLTIKGVRRTGALGWLLLPFTLLYAMAQAFQVLRRRKPDVVLSMGGFVAGPGGLMAWILRKPLLIHEQNAIPGLTNKWLAMIADQVLCGFPGAFGAHIAARPVGNPVRDEIAALPHPEKRLAGRQGNLRLLVVGGSLGAKIFNEVVPAAIRAMPAGIRPEVWHQCGRHNAETVRQEYGDVNARVAEFIDNMAEAYAWADVVLCRAGAMTVAELAASGSAAILVPYLYAVDDHQTANARFLSEREAGVLVPSPELTSARIVELLSGFAANRELLMKMAVAARHLAVTDAAETVAAACRRMINA